MYLWVFRITYLQYLQFQSVVFTQAVGVVFLQPQCAQEQLDLTGLDSSLDTHTHETSSSATCIYMYQYMYMYMVEQHAHVKSCINRMLTEV